MTEDERFFAWLDGELGEEETKLVSAQVAANPSLSSLAERHRALKEKLHLVFNAVPAPRTGLHLVSDRSDELDEQQDENTELSRQSKGER